MMNEFKVGDKVETPFGVGVIVSFNYHLGMDGCKSYAVRLNYKMDDTTFYDKGNSPLLNLTTNELKPYKSAHEKLLKLGFKEEIQDRSVEYEVTSGQYKQYVKYVESEVILIDLDILE